MTCQYSKYIDNLLSGELDENKIIELRNHSNWCDECANRLKTIGQIDNLMKDVLIDYSFISNKKEILEKIKMEKKKKSYFIKLYYYRKPIYIASSIIFFVFSINYIKPILNNLIYIKQSVSNNMESINKLKLPINVENIKAITMPGEEYNPYFEPWFGMPRITKGDPESETRARERLDILAKEKASYITQWVSFINSYTNLRKSSQDEINSIGYKYRTPTTLILTNGDFIHLYPVIEKVEFKDTLQGKLTIKIPYMDRYIIAYEKNDGSGSNINYYTLFSKSPLIYQLKPSGENIFKRFSIDKVNSDGTVSKEFSNGTTDLLKNNDKMIISGISYGSDVIEIYIKDGSDITDTPDPVKQSSSSVLYMIAKIESIVGEWSIEKTISKNMKTYDGKEFLLDDKLYYSQVDYKDANGQRLGASSRGLADLSK
jgi:hypothetical protein